MKPDTFVVEYGGRRFAVVEDRIYEPPYESYACGFYERALIYHLRLHMKAVQAVKRLDLEASERREWWQRGIGEESECP